MFRTPNICSICPYFYNPKHLLNMPSQGKLKLTSSKVPNFDCPVSTSSTKPFIAWIKCKGPNPTQVTSQDPVKVHFGKPFSILRSLRSRLC